MFTKITNFKSVFHITYSMTHQVQAPGVTHRKKLRGRAPLGSSGCSWGIPRPPSQWHLFAWCHIIAPVLPHYQSAVWLPT